MLYELAAALGGAFVAAQIAMNGQTRMVLGGPLWAALANNIVGLAGLSLALLATGASWPGMAGVRLVHPLHWAAGLLGAAFIVMSAWVGPRLGLATTFVLVLAGQLGASLMIDHFGLFTGTPRPANPDILLGVCLVFFGALLVVRAR